MDIPNPNPLFYVVPDTGRPGVFSKTAIQLAVGASFATEIERQNAAAIAQYNLAWTDYKNARDANMGNPQANVPEPSPDFKAKLVHDADGNPGWFVDIYDPVCTPHVYVPPVYHQPDQLGTSLLVRNAPVGDPNPIGFSFVDISGQWGPAGTTWTKVSSPTPFGPAIYYQGK